jgi:hypothetical protein
MQAGFTTQRREEPIATFGAFSEHAEVDVVAQGAEHSFNSNSSEI